MPTTTETSNQMHRWPTTADVICSKTDICGACKSPKKPVVTWAEPAWDNLGLAIFGLTDFIHKPSALIFCRRLSRSYLLRADCNTLRNSAVAVIGGWQVKPEQTTANDAPVFN